MLFQKTFTNIKRIRQIIGIMVKYGFEDLVISTSLRKFVPQKQRINWVRQEKPVFEYSRWERIRMAAEELGPTFIKFAQVLSNRPDLMPDGLITEFQKLQNKVPPFDSEIAKAIIERELQKPIDEMFSEFDPKPLGSASIGQVHKAKLKTGEDVVIKVQRPGVGKQIETDISIIKDIVLMAESYLERNGVINTMDVVESFERTMSKELQYIHEARSIEQFREFYKDHKNFYVPKAYKKLSTDKVLILEYVEGCKITDVKQVRAWGHDPKKIAEEGMEIYLTQIFQYGYFHADPHPGNVLVTPEGTICLIDFGMVGKLMKQDKYAFAGLFIAMAQQDARKMAISFRALAIDSNIKDSKQFEYDLNELIEDFALLDVEESSMADMGTRLQKIIYDYRMKVPGGVFLILRALAILEGIGKMIHPQFATYEFIAPWGKKMLQEQFSPENIASEASYRASSLYSFLSTFPTEVKQIIKKLRRGELEILTKHTGYEPLLQKLDFITNRLTITFLICALLLGSAISMTADFAEVQKTSFGVPYISMAGLLIAGGLAVILLITIFRSGKY